MYRKLSSIFYGWWIVIASFFLLVVAGGTALYGFTAFFNPISEEMGFSSALTSLGFSLRSMEGGVIQPAIGFFIERVGIRNCILAGLAIEALGLFLLSRLTGIPTFYIGFILLSIGYTLSAGIPEYTAVANWFRKRRGLALGLTTAGFGFSGIMTPIFIFMIHSTGWRTTLLILCPAILIICVPLTFVLRTRPESYGMRPDGAKPVAEPPKESGTVNGQKNAASQTEEQGFTIRQCMAKRTFWLLMLYSFFTQFSGSAIQVLEMPHLVNAGISEDLAALTMMGITIGSVTGRLGFSWLGDIYSKKKLLIIAAILQAAGVFIFAKISSPWMIIPFLLIYSPGYGAPIPLIPAIQADYFGTRAFASVRGMVSIGTAISGIIGPLFAGWLFDRSQTYSTAFVIYAVLAAVAVPVMMMATVTRSNPSPEVERMLD